MFPQRRAADAPWVAAVLAGILLVKRKNHKTSLQTFSWPLFSRAQAVVWLMPTSTPRQASVPYFQDTHFITISLCHHTVQGTMEVLVSGLVFRFFFKSRRDMGRQKTRTVLAREQGSKDRHCSWHHQYSHLPFTLPLSPSFDPKSLLQPNSVTCGSGSVVAKARRCESTYTWKVQKETQSTSSNAQSCPSLPYSL